jgi:predicted helicase
MASPAAEISAYIQELDELYRGGIGCPAAAATEHSYRPALKTLFEKITTGLTITNEPKHIECGAPDYIITKNGIPGMPGIPLGYIEAKDIPVGIDDKQNKAQFDRYRRSLNNLIITNYLSFRLFADGEEVVTITIANVKNGGIVPDKKQFDAFLELISQFTGFSGKTISNSEQLAKMMAEKARLLAETIKKALKSPSSETDTLNGQYEAFKKILIHNLGVSEFADIYAQTLAYGLFAARLNQEDSRQFTRLLAAQLIPQSNPFLRKFFQHIAGFDLDSRITWIVDALADVFNCASVEDIKNEFEKAAQDPYIHFYETFLAEYDPALRETRGVYYTPPPVVKFIVQAVDDILKTEFNLESGLADHSKIKRAIPGEDDPPVKIGAGETAELHKVQILDPAAGTGTFLAEIIDKIYDYFAKNKGMWNDYCEKHLIPRLHGFEILMASYAMAHFKLDMKLRETGFSNNRAGNRFNVYLTNTLEEAPEKVPELFMAQWLAQEAEEAGRIKRDAPVMVVIANPPYNVSTQNKNEWIDSLIADYKKDLNEKKLNLDDDYIKFIRYGQMLIEKNGAGILAYITNNSFIDGITHRTMRGTLLEKFDKIYILNLHGNSRKRETSPDGGADGNVFDIMQGTSISLFIKTGEKKEDAVAKIYHSEKFGRREIKYNFLYENTLSTITWTELHPEAPYFFFVPKDFSEEKKYNKGFSVTELFVVYNSGVKTDRDSLFIDIEKKRLSERITILLSGKYDDQFIEQYNIKDSSSYKLTQIIKGKKFDSKNITAIQYRPFDWRYIYYQQGIISRPAYNVMSSLLYSGNAALVTCRNQNYKTAGFITGTLCDLRCYSNPGSIGTDYVFPLYLYPDENSLDINETRRPNFNMDIVNKFAENIQLAFTGEKQDAENTFAPVDMLDYIYAVLHSSSYRLKYGEFLKIDFPRIPYPENAEMFQKLVSIGSLLRKLHLMEGVSPAVDIAAFPITGTNEIETLAFKEGKVYINKHQYFENVSQQAWDYYTGGYQPAQKWLKDRKGKILVFEDIEHYQKIIFVLLKTIEIQLHIDDVLRL